MTDETERTDAMAEEPALALAYQRGLDQAALIGLCGGEQRSVLAANFVRHEFCDDPLSAAAAVTNAAALIINVDALQLLLDKPLENQEFDRSAQLRPLFKAFYRDVVKRLSGGRAETDIVVELQSDYDFPPLVLSHFVSMVESSLSEDIEHSQLEHG